MTTDNHAPARRILMSDAMVRTLLTATDRAAISIGFNPIAC